MFAVVRVDLSSLRLSFVPVHVAAAMPSLRCTLARQQADGSSHRCASACAAAATPRRFVAIDACVACSAKTTSLQREQGMLSSLVQRELKDAVSVRSAGLASPGPAVCGLCRLLLFLCLRGD